MQPRIFGPYESIRRVYPIAEYRADLEGTGVTRSVYVQTNWPNDRFEDEAVCVFGTAVAVEVMRPRAVPRPLRRQRGPKPGRQRGRARAAARQRRILPGVGVNRRGRDPPLLAARHQEHAGRHGPPSGEPRHPVLIGEIESAFPGNEDGHP